MVSLSLKKRLSEERKRFPCANAILFAALGSFLFLLLSLTGCATSNARSSNVQGVESFSAGNYDEAIAYFQDSLKENPTSAETYYNLGSAYQRKANQTGDRNLLTQAENAYWKALQLSPAPETIVCCYRGIATSSTARGDSVGAMQTLEEWRDRNPDSIEPQLEIAYLLEAQGRDDDAYELLEQIAELAPNDYRAYYKMGVLAERAENLSTAVEQTKVAAQLSPSNAEITRRAKALEAQYAIQQRRKQTDETAVTPQQEAASGLAAGSAPVTVQTAKVQSTSAQGESEPIPDLILPPEEAQPVQDAVPSPVSGTPDSASTPQLGFGEVVLFSASSPDAKLAQTTPKQANLAQTNTTRFGQGGLESTRQTKPDDSDVKWISATSPAQPKVAQTSATELKPVQSKPNTVSAENLAESSNTGNTTAQTEPVPTETKVSTRQEDTSRYKEPETKRVKPPREMGAGLPRIKAGSFF